MHTSDSKGVYTLRLALLKVAPIGAGAVAFGLSGGTALAQSPADQVQEHLNTGQTQLQGHAQTLQDQFNKGKDEVQGHIDSGKSQLSSGLQSASQGMGSPSLDPPKLGLNSSSDSKSDHKSYEKKKVLGNYQKADQDQKSEQSNSNETNQVGPNVNTNIGPVGGGEQKDVKQSGNSNKTDQQNESDQQQLIAQSIGSQLHPWLKSDHPWGHNQIDP